MENVPMTTAAIMFKRPELPSISTLPSLGSPRVHPNGFIQLDLDNELRLHVWHPRLPYRQRTYHPVHDHVFAFTSYLYSGRLVHVHYELWPSDDATHFMWQARAIGPEESVLEVHPSMEPVKLRPVRTKVLQPGDMYTFLAGEFHETLSNVPTLTIIRKIGPTIHQGSKRQPSIAVPVGVRPDNDFRRDAVDLDVLWELIKEAHPNGQS